MNQDCRKWFTNHRMVPSSSIFLKKTLFLPFDSVWSSSYPHVLTSSGEFYYNYLDETYYYANSTPVFFVYNDYADYYPGAYQYMVPIIYEYHDDYFYSPIYGDFQAIPSVNYYVPLFYYIPVYDVPVAYSFDDVYSQCYIASYELRYSNTFEYPISVTSLPFDSVWSSSYPHVLTSSGEFYYNYLDETYYYGNSTPVFFGYFDYADYYPCAYQSMVPVIYEYHDDYFYSPIYGDFQASPSVNYYVPLLYYIPVYDVPVAYNFDDVYSQCYKTAYELRYSNTFEYPISETSDGSLRNYSAISEECRTFEVFYKEDGDILDEAYFNDGDKRQNNDDDKRENDDDKNLTSDSEESYYSSSDESVDDKKESKTLTRFGNCWDLSQIDGGNRSDSHDSSDDDVSDVHSTVQYCRQAASYNNRVRLRTDVDVSDEELSSSQESDLDKKENNEIKRFKNVLDLSVVDDDDESLISDIDDNYVEYLSPQESDLDEKEHSAIKKITTYLDDSQSNDDERRSQENFDTLKLEATRKNIPVSFHGEISKSKSQLLKEKILTSKEYTDIQENLEYSEHNKQWLYKLALKKNPRRNNDILLDYLPPLIEEVLVPISEEDENVENVSSHFPEIVSIDIDDGSEKENKQQKKRFKGVRKFLSRVFCCCTKKPPP